MRVEGNVLYVGKRTYNIDNMPEATKIKLGLIKKNVDIDKPEKVKRAKKEVKEGE